MATTTFGLSSSVVNSNKTYGGSDADSVALLDWASSAYSAAILAQPATGKFTGSISATTLTATAVASGQLAINQYIYGPSILPGTRITALGTGGGGPGTYTINISQTVASEAMQSYGPDIVATGLYQGTMNAWIEAQQKYAKDGNVAAVPTPPPMGWT
jgi:hypothetical protein